MNLQMTYAVMYLELNLIAVILVGIIRYKTAGISRMVAQRNFAMAIDAEMGFFLSDTFYVMMANGVIPYHRTLVMISKEIYFFSTMLMCFFWFLYFEYLQDSPFVQNRKRMWASSVLVVVMTVLLLVNIYTGIFFYVDSDGSYQRGKFFLIQYVLSYIYVLITCFRALLGIFQKEKYAKRKTLIWLALFPLAPAGAGIVQFVYPQLPLACSALSLATLVMYLNWTGEMISVDPLTKLNNRKQLAHNYDQWSQNLSEDMPLYLMIIDANKFKGINDTYGHIEGDAALVRIADALRYACRDIKGRAVIARYGGDEFVILLQTDIAELIDTIRNKIQDKLQELNEEAKAPYELTVSIGMAKAASGISMKALIEEADARLYDEKRVVHEQKN